MASGIVNCHFYGFKKEFEYSMDVQVGRERTLEEGIIGKSFKGIVWENKF